MNNAQIGFLLIFFTIWLTVWFTWLMQLARGNDKRLRETILNSMTRMELRLSDRLEQRLESLSYIGFHTYSKDEGRSWTSWEGEMSHGHNWEDGRRFVNDYTYTLASDPFPHIPSEEE